uniref:Purine nucleoside permease n=1 Tax=Kwoniella bestiolae CBS 10118 TaxID=1296100 RepID=A0A1B9G7H0_9TREE|nr:hypothetical protein I302_04669 [Kwoniella bestiolae CBS 10118]OCF26977.1 hypothetical protein I302_04669 [Kwoniella bestiolae CBS 10118]
MVSTTSILASALAITSSLVSASPTFVTKTNDNGTSGKLEFEFPLKPKIMLISLFAPEDVWTQSLGLTNNITLPGLSPLFPSIGCNDDASICHMTTGESEINAACSTSAMLLADEFDFTSTYFLIGGIAGINPYMGTTGSVGFARYAVQVALGYEIDSRQIPSNWSTGYWLFGSSQPGEPATTIYGTEVYELNTNLREKVMGYLGDVQLNDTAEAAEYRSKYDYSPANQSPQIFKGDVATSDVYFAGNLLDEAFGNITSLWTNGTGKYALTAEEDNAIFEAMVRSHTAKKMDFSRVVLMRTASDFDRGYGGSDAWVVTAFQAEQYGFEIAIANIQIAYTPIIEGILNDWDSTFSKGVSPQDEWLYNADIFHTLVQRKREVREFERMMKRSQVGKFRR